MSSIYLLGIFFVSKICVRITVILCMTYGHYVCVTNVPKLRSWCVGGQFVNDWHFGGAIYI